MKGALGIGIAMDGDGRRLAQGTKGAL
ncbi:hypothetical protein J2S03_002991, partial [Alicyclobacillus cycloheptanicus]|nr:hypothetical protein [Alicyclobacillus cycloheptanicus]